MTLNEISKGKNKYIGLIIKRRSVIVC